MKTALIWFAIPLVPALTSLGLAPQRQGVPAGTVAYISAQRITAETPEGKASVARMQALQRERGDDLRQKQQAIETTRSQLAMAQADGRARLQAQEQQQRSDLERAVARMQADLQALQRQTSADVLARVRGVVGEIVKGRDIQVVLNLETAVMWAAPSLDLTDAVIARMNAVPAEKTPPK